MHRIKKWIPASLRLCYALCRRRGRDLLSGSYKKFSCQRVAQKDFYTIVKIEQAIRPNGWVSQKLHNIDLAIEKINDIVIPAGAIFSFWKLVGNPSQKNGYQKSRTIKGNNLKEESGGGLCQLSGLIYYLAIHAGLTITERHPHSLDIYREEERFTPLGSDATIVYGYKDLRFVNEFTFPVSISFQLTEDRLTGKISGAEKAEPVLIEFEYRKQEAFTDADCICTNNGKRFLLNSSRYGILR